MSKLKLGKCNKKAKNFKFSSLVSIASKKRLLYRSSRPHGGTRSARHDGTSFCQLHPPTHPFPCSVHHEDNLVQVRLPLICFDLSLRWLFQLLLVKSRPREVSFPTLIYLQNHELLELFFFQKRSSQKFVTETSFKKCKSYFFCCCCLYF